MLLVLVQATALLAMKAVNIPVFKGGVKNLRLDLENTKQSLYETNCCLEKYDMAIFNVWTGKLTSFSALNTNGKSKTDCHIGIVDKCVLLRPEIVTIPNKINKLRLERIRRVKFKLELGACFPI